MHPEDPERARHTPGATLGLASELAGVVGLVFHGLKRATRRGLTEQPLSSSEVDLLRLARKRPGIRMGDAAAALALAPNTLTTLVNRACEVGFLYRERATTDRRVVHLTLSEKGAARLATWRDLRAETLAEVLADLPAADRDALAGALPALTRLAAELDQLGGEGV